MVIILFPWSLVGTVLIGWLIRHGKMYDLRPLIQEIAPLPGNSHPMQRVRVILTAREGAMGRPDEVILALGHNPEEARVHRLQLIFK